MRVSLARCCLRSPAKLSVLPSLTLRFILPLQRDRQARICCFSPCIEQVIRTCTALSELGFSDITMYETLTRTHDPTPIAAPSIETAIQRIEEVEDKKGRRREGQIKEAARRREEKRRLKEEEEAAKVKAETEATSESTAAAAVAPTSTDDVDSSEPAAKRVKRTAVEDEEEGANDVGMATDEVDDATPAPARAATIQPADSAATTPAAHALAEKTAQGRRLREERDRERSYGTKAGAYTRGHTSFLTFAVLLPEIEGLQKPASLLGSPAPAATAAAEGNPVEEEKPIVGDAPVDVAV